jgi:hypothetical protein
MKSYFLVVLVLFVTAMAFSARLSIAWPYRENWPYTGLVYGAMFLVLTAIAMITLRKHLIKPHSKISAATIGVSFLLYFLVSSAFLCFGVRFLTEPQFSYSFAKAKVIEKFRSDHNGPALSLQREDGTIIKLDIPGQDAIWHQAEIGSVVSKQFGKEEIIMFSEPEPNR